MKNFILPCIASLALVVCGASPALAKEKPQSVPKMSEVPNKTALANWMKTKQRPVTAANKVAKVKSMSMAQRAAAETDASAAKTANFKCGLLYSDTWDEDYPMYGAYTFSLSDVSTMTRKYYNSEYPPNAGGFFTEDKYYFTSYVVDDWGWDYEVKTYVVDTNTWKVSQTVDQGSMYAMAQDLAYDPIEKKAFGSFYANDDNATYWGFMDPATCEITQIKKIDGSIVAVAANEQGEMYGITSGGYLVKIDKYSGNLTTIGNTNISPSYLQSATFDENGTFYWAAGFSDGSTGLFTVNLETARVTLVSAFNDDQEVVALYAEPSAADVGAPANPSDLKLNFVADALSGTISFAVPNVDNQGASIEGDVTYTVSIDGTDVATGTATAGTTANVPVSVTKAGVHSFSIRLKNNAGESKRVSISQWIGIDRPEAVSDLKMEKTGDLQATISWNAPTKGALNGFFDIDRVSYTVTRLPEEVVVAKGLKTTSFVDNLEFAGKKYINYRVTPYADDAEGTAAVTNGIVFGNALDVPVNFTFENEAEYNIFTVIDNNETINLDSGMWEYSPSGQCAGYVSGTKDGDDWLITPEINLKADRQYLLSYDVLCYSDYWPDNYELFMGSGATIQAMTTRLLEPTTIYWDEYRTKTIVITVPADGTYNFGFHALSEAGGAFFLLDNVKLVESYMLKAPVAVSDLTVTAGEKGALQATVAFTAPSKAIDGSDLSELTSIEVMRLGNIVKVFENPAIGAKLSFEESGLENGFAEYTLVAHSLAGAGVEASAKSWVGIDTPSEPTVHMSVTNGNPTLTWEAPTAPGQNGGYFDNTNLTYIVYRANDSKVLASDCTSMSYTDTEIPLSDDAAQQMYQYGVFAQQGENIGYPGMAYVIDGKPYNRPFAESFAKGKSDNLWLISSDNGEAWKIADDWSADPQDSDGGMLMITPSTPGGVSTALSGKIDMRSAKNATLTFYLDVMTYISNGFEEANPAEDYLEVLVGTTGFEPATALTIRPNDCVKGQYVKYTVPLTQWEGKDFIYIGFRLNSVAALAPMIIDNIVVRDNYNVNLALSNVTVPASANATQTFNVTATVKNDGVSEANGYTVTISRDDDVLATQTETEALAAGSTRKYTFELTALPAWGSSEVLTASVAIDNDERADDNSAEGSIKVIRPEMPVINDFSVVTDGNSATFAWSEPAISNNVKVTEDFESYTHNARSGIGSWTLIDEDKVMGIDDFKAGSNYLDITGVFAYRSWTILNPAKAGADYTEAPEWAPHSGNQVIVALANWELDNDDWLVTPRLSGEAQTVSFWARSIKSGGDKLYVYYSTGDAKVDAMIRVDDYKITPGDSWTKYSYDLPAGATYFALRYYTSSGKAVLVDDFEFEMGSEFPVPMTIDGYNLYKDDVRVNEEPIKTTSHVISNAESGIYHVTVQYNLGESDKSNSVNVEISGVENITIDNDNDAPTYDIYGRRVYDLKVGQIYVRKGQKFVYGK